MTTRSKKTFTKDDFKLMEKLYQKEKHTAKPVTKEWIKKILKTKSADS